MKKFGSYIFISVVLILLIGTITSCVTVVREPGDSSSPSNEKVSLKNTFQEDKFAFSIRYPGDWSYDISGYIVTFSGKKDTPAYYSTVSVQNLASVKNGGTYENVDSVINDIKNKLGTASNTRFHNENAFIYTMENGEKLTGKQFTSEYTYQGEDFKQLQIVVPRSDGLAFHAWAYISPVDQYNTYLGIAQAMLDSWVIQPHLSDKISVPSPKLNTYTNGFSISYPLDWIKTPEKDMSADEIMAFKHPTTEFYAGVSVYMWGLETVKSLESVYQYELEHALKETLKRYTEISKNNLTVDGIPAIRSIINATYNDGYEEVWEAIYLVRDKTVLIAECVCNIKDYESLKSTFNSILNSFHVLM